MTRDRRTMSTGLSGSKNVATLKTLKTHYVECEFSPALVSLFPVIVTTVPKLYSNLRKLGSMKRPMRSRYKRVLPILLPQQEQLTYQMAAESYRVLSIAFSPPLPSTRPRIYFEQHTINHALGFRPVSLL